MTVHKIGSEAWKKLVTTKNYPEYMPKPVVDSTELRLRSIEQSVNLILKRLETNAKETGKITKENS